MRVYEACFFMFCRLIGWLLICFAGHLTNYESGDLAISFFATFEPLNKG